MEPGAHRCTLCTKNATTDPGRCMRCLCSGMADVADAREQVAEAYRTVRSRHRGVTTMVKDQASVSIAARALETCMEHMARGQAELDAALDKILHAHEALPFKTA